MDPHAKLRGVIPLAAMVVFNGDGPYRATFDSFDDFIDHRVVRVLPNGHFFRHIKHLAAGHFAGSTRGAFVFGFIKPDLGDR